MTTLQSDSNEAQRIDAALKEWRQDDVAPDEAWFVHVGDPEQPLSEAAAGAENKKGIQALTSEVAGLVVVTQTCDIIRSCIVRPYIEAAPLVPVGPETLQEVLRGGRPSLAMIPALMRSSLVANIDRVMTVEKSIVASWKRTEGCSSDTESRALARALARKRMRFAFPEDFLVLSKKLRTRLIDKHEKNTDEGRGLRALREIRVHAARSWDADEVEIFFWFIRNEGDFTFEGKNWADLLREWLKLVPAHPRFRAVDGQVVSLVDMTAADYVHSDPLDLDHLSSGNG